MTRIVGVGRRMKEFYTRRSEAPAWLTATALLLGASGALLVPGLAIWSLTPDGPGVEFGIVLAGLAVAMLWGLWAVADSFLAKVPGLGGRIGLLGLIVTLLGQLGFASGDNLPCQVALLWTAGVLITVWGLEDQRRKLPRGIVDPRSTRTATPGGCAT